MLEWAGDTFQIQILKMRKGGKSDFDKNLYKYL